MASIKKYPVLYHDGSLVDIEVPDKFLRLYWELTHAAYRKGKQGIPIKEFLAWLKEENYISA